MITVVGSAVQLAPVGKVRKSVCGEEDVLETILGD